MGSLPVPGRGRDFVEIPTAAQAKEKSEMYEKELIEQRKLTVLNLILNDIEAGKFETIVSGGIPKIIKEELISKGYKIRSYNEEWDWGDVIKWS